MLKNKCVLGFLEKSLPSTDTPCPRGACGSLAALRAQASREMWGQGHGSEAHTQRALLSPASPMPYPSWGVRCNFWV